MIKLDSMSSDEIYSKFGIQSTISQGAQNLLGALNILMSEGVKTEQTAMMVQNMLQSQPLLYRRFIESKLSRFNK